MILPMFLKASTESNHAITVIIPSSPISESPIMISHAFQSFPNCVAAISSDNDNQVLLLFDSIGGLR